jgi:hypothetical protein
MYEYIRRFRTFSLHFDKLMLLSSIIGTSAIKSRNGERGSLLDTEDCKDQERHPNVLKTLTTS